MSWVSHGVLENIHVHGVLENIQKNPGRKQVAKFMLNW